MTKSDKEYVIDLRDSYVQYDIELHQSRDFKESLPNDCYILNKYNNCTKARESVLKKYRKIQKMSFIIGIFSLFASLLYSILWLLSIPTQNFHAIICALFALISFWLSHHYKWKCRWRGKGLDLNYVVKNYLNTYFEDNAVCFKVTFKYATENKAFFDHKGINIELIASPWIIKKIKKRNNIAREYYRLYEDNTASYLIDFDFGQVNVYGMSYNDILLNYEHVTAFIKTSDIHMQNQ